MNATKSRRFVFNTDAFPERDRFPAFCEGIFRNVIGADVLRTGNAPFHGELDLRLAGQVKILDMAATPVEIIRGAPYTRDGDDAFVVQLWQRGPAALFHNKREIEITGHTGFVIDNSAPATIIASKPVRFLALAIPRRTIDSRIASIDMLAGAKIGNELAIKLLNGYLAGTSKLDFDDAAIGDLFGSHLTDLVALALTPESYSHDLEASGGVRAARLVAILEAISKHSADQHLGAASIGARLGITPRYVHLLLEQSGRSFTQHVLQKRLERVQELLRDDHAQKRRIADIANEAGFSDISHFNHAFRRQFGDTPSSVRAIYAKRRLQL
jgi:AraC-like DNA-binding protein